MSFRNLPEARHEENGITYFLWDPITMNGQEHRWYAIQMHFIQRGELYVELVRKHVQSLHRPGDVLSLSEKTISMCQNNAVEKKDVRIGFWVCFLSKLASSNNHGIAVDESYKLQLAINLTGLSKILLASSCPAVMKLFGVYDVFYEVARHGIDRTDGFYTGSPSELYRGLALLNPEELVGVCNNIQQELGIDCLLVDTDDLSIVISGKSDTLASVPDQDLIAMVRDSPVGQSGGLAPPILIERIDLF